MKCLGQTCLIEDFPEYQMRFYVTTASAASKANSDLLARSLQDLVDNLIKSNLKNYDQFNLTGRQKGSDEATAAAVV